MCGGSGSLIFTWQKRKTFQKVTPSLTRQFSAQRERERRTARKTHTHKERERISSQWQTINERANRTRAAGARTHGSDKLKTHARSQREAGLGHTLLSQGARFNTHPPLNTHTQTRTHAAEGFIQDTRCA